jgi:hypothetical protein
LRGTTKGLLCATTIETLLYLRLQNSGCPLQGWMLEACGRPPVVVGEVALGFDPPVMPKKALDVVVMEEEAMETEAVLIDVAFSLGAAIDVALRVMIDDCEGMKEEKEKEEEGEEVVEDIDKDEDCASIGFARSRIDNNAALEGIIGNGDNERMTAFILKASAWRE